MLFEIKLGSKIVPIKRGTLLMLTNSIKDKINKQNKNRKKLVKCFLPTKKRIFFKILFI